MKARKRLGAIVAHIISARRERQRGSSDLLASFLDDREALTDAQIADNVIGVMFAARDTTASVLTWMVKFLGDHPSVLKAVIVSTVLFPWTFRFDQNCCIHQRLILNLTTG
jgi:(+)-abscisic acid 8'-hydroxylase